MGCITKFTGQWKLNKRLLNKHINYLTLFSEIRHVKHDERKMEKVRDDLRKSVGLPVGSEGSYCLSDDSFVLFHNVPPGQLSYDEDIEFFQLIGKNKELIETGQCQPSLWCDWKPNDEGDAIIWNDVKSFFEFIPWIKYLIKHFLGRWGYKLNGDVKWSNKDGWGTIHIVDNEVTVF